jgi:peptide/nickel transport system permease protein
LAGEPAFLDNCREAILTVPKVPRRLAAALIAVVFALSLLAGYVTNTSYSTQFRKLPNARPSAHHILGTDSLGRDSFARLLYATRVSLSLAPASALLATLIAGLLGAWAGLRGGWCERAVLVAADLSMALPLLFVLIALRALLPLDVSPFVALIATFLTLGLLGWPSSLRVIWSASRQLRNSDVLLLAHASGIAPTRIVVRHLLPNLRPILFAQFWISIPLFILTETTLSMLGLGVMEPIPSWGNLLRGLEDFSVVSANPWRLAPLFLLVLVVVCFQFALPSQEELV